MARGPTAALMLASLMLAPVTLASDPTQPEVQLDITPGAVAAVTPALPVLSMIRSQGTSQQAFINGEWYRVGEKIGVYRVRNISVSQVTLQQGERQLVLNLFKTTTITTKK
jgi:hypothetical protein